MNSRSNATGDNNLVGTSGTTNESYGGLSLLAVANSDDTDLSANNDVLILGLIDINANSPALVTGTVLIRSETRLRAQDIYVYGSIDGTNTDDPLGNNGMEDDPMMDTLNKSAPLDNYLNRIIISDGQFN